MNLNQAFIFNANKAISDIGKSKAIFSSKLRDYTGDNEEEIVDAYVDSQKDKLKNYKNLRNIIKSYRILGMNENDFLRSLTKDFSIDDRGKFDIILDADTNFFVPDGVSDTDFGTAEFETQVPLPLNKILQLEGKLLGQPID